MIHKTMMNSPDEMIEADASISSETILKLNKKNIELYKNLALPKENEEDWRYTDVERLKLENFEGQLTGNKFNGGNNIRITKLPEIFKEKGAVFCSIREAFDEHHDLIQKYFFKSIRENKDKFTAMNSSYLSNGAFLFVPKNTNIDIAINAVFKHTNSNAIHNGIIVEENSSVDFVEEHYCAEEDEKNKEMLINEVTEIFVHDSALINFHYLNRLNKNTCNFTNLAGNASRDSRINWFSACFGGKINRVRIDTLFNGKGSQSENTGLFLGKGKEHIDITTNVYHNAESTTNNIMFDGILTDSSTSVYRGLIRIEKTAQKTNSYLSNHILKIGSNTLANSIPALKIEANDVKASHGATIGHINDDHLFYLMTRGLSINEAEQMITRGFLEPIIEKIKIESLRNKIRGMIGE